MTFLAAFYETRTPLTFGQPGSLRRGAVDQAIHLGPAAGSHGQMPAPSVLPGNRRTYADAPMASAAGNRAGDLRVPALKALPAAERVVEPAEPVEPPAPLRAAAPMPRRRSWYEPFGRDLTKTITFLILHLAVGFTVAYIFTGSIAVASGIALVEPLVNAVVFFFHERAWRRTDVPLLDILTHRHTREA